MSSTPPTAPPPPRSSNPAPRTPPVYEVVAHEYVFLSQDINSSRMGTRSPPTSPQSSPEIPTLPPANRRLFTDLSSWQNRSLDEFNTVEATTLCHNYAMACHDNADLKKTFSRLQSEVQELRAVTDGLTAPELGLTRVVEQAREAIVSEHKAQERCRELERVLEEMQKVEWRRIMILEGILIALVAAWVIASDSW